MSDLPTTKQLIKWGAHLGHLRKVMHPSFKPYVLEVKEKVVIIDPSKTLQQLKKALEFFKKSKEKNVLWVSTKVISKDLVKEIAESLGHSYICEKWLGGMLTNFETLKKNLQKMEELKSGEETIEYKDLTKKERGILAQKREKMEKILYGLRNLKSIPDILIVVDPAHEKIAVSEAKRKGSTIVGLCDVQSNSWKIDYSIPINDESRTTVKNILKIMARSFEPTFDFAEKKKSKTK
ncbi:MAG: 30S ribosomal protein S2 [Patescibacteria group bacterium]|nr:30S ribosomal protein S2 [Patescibacteria group bacterium]